ncbi:MAG TPA: glycosyltransferase [Flavobacteriaceae bacterium]|nr:glycosyltransferase [Flavobacteriaceae bacterium]
MSDKQTFFRPKLSDRHVDDKQHILLTHVIHYYFDQESPSAILDLLSKYSKYSSEVLDVIQFVIVDDGSPLEFNIPKYNLNITWLRITDNILWNQPGARNLGITYAKSDKVLFADLDHEFPEHTLKRMTEMGRLGRKFYKIWRLNKEDNTTIRPHPNTFLVSRGRFFELYGYDEEYSGAHGGEDYRFVKFQKNHGSWQRKLPKRFYCTKREEINRDSAYHSLDRDQSRNTPIDHRKRNELILWGDSAGHSRIFLNFKWEIVFNYNRKGIPKRKDNRLWKKLWIFRTLKAIIC